MSIGFQKKWRGFCVKNFFVNYTIEEAEKIVS